MGISYLCGSRIEKVGRVVASERLDIETHGLHMKTETRLIWPRINGGLIPRRTLVGNFSLGDGT
jgi:hypothetical protein